MKYFLCLICILFFSSTLQARGIERKDYIKIDSFVGKLGPLDGLPLKTIVDTITSSGKDEISSVRAIYYWIATNVSFDSKGFHHAKQYNSSASAALTERKATSEGYANLFQAMCDLDRIQCYTVHGYAKKDSKSIGKLTSKNEHTWNVVEIKGVQYVIDATWGAGTTDLKLRDFEKDYTDAWFFTDRHLFALSHFPDDKKWQLLDTPINKSVFTAAPIVGSAAVIFDVHPQDGIRGALRGKADSVKTISYYVSDPAQIKTVTASIDFDKMPVIYTVTGHTLQLNMPFPISGKYPVSIYVNNKFAFAYKAAVHKRRKVKKHTTHKKFPNSYDPNKDHSR